MNRKQWFVFGVGLALFGLFLLSLRGSACLDNGDLLTACYIRRYAFSIPALILHFLGWLFIICGSLESKK